MEPALCKKENNCPGLSQGTSGKSLSQSPKTVESDTGRKILLGSSDKGDILVVENPEGFIELSVIFTGSGPVLNFQSGKINLKSDGDLNFDCKNLAFNALCDVKIKTGGDLVQEVKGEIKTEARGKSTHKARAVDIESDLGNVKIKANDDVLLDGERVRLNC